MTSRDRVSSRLKAVPPGFTLVKSSSSASSRLEGLIGDSPSSMWSRRLKGLRDVSVPGIHEHRSGVGRFTSSGEARVAWLARSKTDATKSDVMLAAQYVSMCRVPTSWELSSFRSPVSRTEKSPEHAGPTQLL